MKASPRGHFAIYNRATGAVRTVVRMRRRDAIQNLRPGEWSVPCEASQYPPGTVVARRKVVVGGEVDRAHEYAELRQVAILEAWPVAAQIEALTEAAADRPEKLAALQAHIAAVKAQYPKA